MVTQKQKLWQLPCLAILIIHLLPEGNGKQCEQPVIDGVKMIRLTPDSKYLYPEHLDPNRSHLGDDFTFCDKGGLRAANIKTTADYWHLFDNLVVGKRVSTSLFQISLGGRNPNQRNIFRSINTDLVLPLTLFHMDNFHYYESTGACLSLQCRAGRYCYMKNHNCTHHALIICQYPEKSKCYRESPLHKLEVKEQDTLRMIGNTSARIYYGGTKQKSWKEAMFTCKKKDLKLLDLARVDSKEVASLWETVAEAYMNYIGIPQFAGLSWTSGRFRKGYEDGKSFVWEESTKDGEEGWFWEEGRYYDTQYTWMNESLLRDRKEEKCVFIIWKDLERNKFEMRPMACNQPNYFLCYKKNHDGKKIKKKSKNLKEHCDRPVVSGDKDVQFWPTGPGSRYLYPKGKRVAGAPEVAFELCKGAGLEPAVVESMEDFEHLVKDFVSAKRFYKIRRNFKLALGAMSDAEKPWIFKDVTSGQPIRFQFFPLAAHSTYFMVEKSCLAVECRKGGCFYTTVDCHGSKDLMPLCQHKRDSDCNKRGEVTPKLVEVGHIKDVKYYGSMEQRSWEEAAKYCEEKGYELLSFSDKKGGKIKSLRKIAKEYLKLLDIPEEHAVSWTSGRFDGEFGKNETFSFMGDGDKWRWEDSKNLWRWMSEVVVKDGREERCLLLVAIRSVGEFGMRPMVCDMPNYFICKDKNEGGTKAPPTTEVAPTTETMPTTEAPTTTEDPPTTEDTLGGLQENENIPGEDPTNCNNRSYNGIEVFTITSTGSKYLRPASTSLVMTSEAAYSACVSMGLEPAIVEQTSDYEHLKGILQNMQVALGASDKHRQAVQVDTSVGGMKSAELGLFPVNQTTYLDIRETCLAMECGEGDDCTFENVHCSIKGDLMPICSFKRKSECYEKSTMVLEPEEVDYDYDLPDPELFELGTINGTAYYGSKKQKGWGDAKQTCEERGHELLTFKQEMFAEKDIMWDQIVNTFLQMQAIPLWHPFSWTEGVYMGEEKLAVDTSVELWEWKWMQKDMVQDKANGKCLLVMVMDSADVFGLRPVLCDIPNFFLCQGKGGEVESETYVNYE